MIIFIFQLLTLYNKPSSVADSSFMGFKSFVQKHQSLSENTWELLSTVLGFHSITKSDLTLAEGQVCRFIDYINYGSLRSYYTKDGEEITTGLYLEGVCVTNMASLSKGMPSKLFIQANEDCGIVRMNKDRMIALYQRSPELQSIGRAVLESMVVEENSLREMYALYTPEERYSFLTNKKSALPLRFSLQHIASFLGIRRETLSRIRSRNR